jgi:hypothetical protein
MPKIINHVEIIRDNKNIIFEYRFGKKNNQYSSRDKRFDYIYWSQSISSNPSLIELVRKEVYQSMRYPNVDWLSLSSNTAAIDIIEWELAQAEKENRDTLLYWCRLSDNISAVRLLQREYKTAQAESRKPKIYLVTISKNSSAQKLISEIMEKESNLKREEYNRLTYKDKLDWEELCKNPVMAETLLSIDNFTQTNNYWSSLCENINAVDYLTRVENRDKIDLEIFSSNPGAIDYLKSHVKLENMFWRSLSSNPNASELLNWKITQEQDSILVLFKDKHNLDWDNLSKNYGIIDCLLQEIDYAKKSGRDCKINWQMFTSNPAAIDYLLGEKFITNPKLCVNICKNPYTYLREEIMILGKLNLLPLNYSGEKFYKYCQKVIKKYFLTEQYYIYMPVQNQFTK